MTKYVKLLAVPALALALSGGIPESGAKAESHGVKVKSAWIQGYTDRNDVGTVYLEISNTGSTNDRLIAVSSPSAAMSMIRTPEGTAGPSKMRRLEPLTVKPGETVSLRPGEAHVLLNGLSSPVKWGRPITVQLYFEKAGTITTSAHVHKVKGFIGHTLPQQ